MSLKGASSSVDKKLFIREWRTGGVERRGREGGWEGRGMGRNEEVYRFLGEIDENGRG